MHTAHIRPISQVKAFHILQLVLKTNTQKPSEYNYVSDIWNWAPSIRLCLVSGNICWTLHNGSELRLHYVITSVLTTAGQPWKTVIITSFARYAWSSKNSFSQSFGRIFNTLRWFRSMIAPSKNVESCLQSALSHYYVLKRQANETRTLR